MRGMEEVIDEERDESRNVLVQSHEATQSHRIPEVGGLIKGEGMAVDASTVAANAALRAIGRRETGEGYRDMLTRMAKESGIETPTAEDLIRLDRARKGKKLEREADRAEARRSQACRIEAGRTESD